MKITIVFLALIFLLIFFLTIFITILFASPAWWVYLFIYAGLFLFWYKPVLVFYHSYRAEHLLKAREYEGVSQEYEKIAHIKKNEGYGDFATGMAHYYRKHWQHAEQSLNEALDRGIKTQKKSFEPLARLILFALAMEKGHHDRAEQLYEQLQEPMLKKNKPSPKLKALYGALKGEWLYRQGHEQEALEIFEETYENDRDVLGDEAYYYAKLLIKKGLNEQAESILTQLLEEDQRWKLFRVSYGQVKKLKQQLG